MKTRVCNFCTTFFPFTLARTQLIIHSAFQLRVVVGLLFFRLFCFLLSTLFDFLEGCQNHSNKNINVSNNYVKLCRITPQKHFKNRGGGALF